MQYIDVHSHIQLRQFDSDRDAVLARMREAGVGTIAVGVDRESSKKAHALAQKEGSVLASVGVHPTDVPDEVFDRAFFDELARMPETVAIGECGFDYVRADKTADRERQRELFHAQIACAIAHDLPLMIHARPTAGSMDAYEDVLASLDAFTEGERPRGNVHFFVGTPEIAQQFAARGFTISVTGVITFASDYDEIVRSVPLDMLMAETDSPFAAPVPYRGTRNEPIYVREVVGRIAELHGENEKVVAEALLQNAKRVFAL